MNRTSYLCFFKFELILNNSVKKQLVSDAPLGALLSGGLDSSVMVALLAKLSDKPVRTFTTGFGNELDEFDEANILEKIAGMELSSWRGRGIQGAVVPSFAGGMALGGNLMALGAVPFASPRFTGEAARMFGKTGKYATPTLKTTRA